MQEEPILKAIPNSEIFYYDEFELIDKELYSLIFNKKDLGIYEECYFINKYICIKMPNQLNKNRKTHIYVFGCVYSNHIFKAIYLLEYKSANDFINDFNYANQMGGFDNYITSFIFKNNYIEELTDINNQYLGLIYNIEKASKPGQQFPYPGPAQPGQKFQNPNPVPGPQAPIMNYIPVDPNKPPLMGLKNIGATCYMNATLQCLSQILPLAYYFKTNPQISKYKNKNENCLTKSFKLLIDNLWPEYYNHQKNNNNYFYEPLDFKDKISIMNPVFHGIKAYDVKDLLNFIIITLHNELNTGQKINSGNINSDNQINQNFMLNYFMNTFFKENKSIISDIFYGVTHTMIQCSYCRSTKHNYDAYFSLNFPLEEVRKYKLQELTNTNNNIMNQMNMNQNMFINMNNQMDIYNNNLNKIQLLNQNNIDIYDCFDYNQKIYYDFMGQNQLYCDRCRETAPFAYIKCLYNCPEVLILVLDR